MKTTVEKLSPTRTKLIIEVAPDELKPSIDLAYARLAEQISVPGFRKGKIPAAIINQRVGKGAVLEQAVNEGLDGFYRKAAGEHEVYPLGRPQADVTAWPQEDFSGDLVLSIEVDVRPEVKLPSYDSVNITVDAIEISDDDVAKELDTLRSRFGTLVTVDRPAKTGDFAQIDLVASIADKEVDTATGISYELGSGDLIDGLDEAIDTLTAGESTTFKSPLMGGEHEGEIAEITVTVNSVKERELPEANDDFAQIASEFDTIAELQDSLRVQVERAKKFEQGKSAREKLVEKLLELVDIPVPAAVVEEEVRRHLEEEGRQEDDSHRSEVVESSEKALRTQILVDEIAQTEKVQPSQDEITQYLIQGAAQYGMDPNEFVKILSENGQIQAIIGEVTRNKALAVALGKVKVTDSAGKSVDLAEFAAKNDDADEETAEESEATAEEKPKKKTAAKKK